MSEDRPQDYLPQGYGQVAYQGYFEACGGHSLMSGAALPPWHEQEMAIRDARGTLLPPP